MDSFRQNIEKYILRGYDKISLVEFALRVGVRLSTIPAAMNNMPKCSLMDRILEKYHECSEKLIIAELKVLFFYVNRATYTEETRIEILGKQLTITNQYLAENIHRARIIKMAITDTEFKIYTLINDNMDVFVRPIPQDSDFMQEMRKNAFNNYIRNSPIMPDLLDLAYAIQNTI